MIYIAAAFTRFGDERFHLPACRSLMRQAARFAEGLAEAGHEILNEVVLNQVMVSFGDDDKTRRVIAALQEEGTCWCGGTQWRGRAGLGRGCGDIRQNGPRPRPRSNIFNAFAINQHEKEGVA